MLFRIVKWTLIILAIVLSAVPFAGIIFLAPYLIYYLRLRGRFLAARPRAVP